MTDFVKPDPYRAFSGFGDPLSAPITPRIQIRLDELDLRLDTGDVIVFALSTASSTASCVLSATWRED